MNAVTTNESRQRLLLLRATSLGWIQPDYATSLDELEASALKWMHRWAPQDVDNTWEQLALDFEEKSVNKYQETALDIYLSEWPRDWEYAEIIELVAAGKANEYVVPWEPFERMDSDRLAGEIEATVDLLETRFVPRTKGA